MTTRALVLLLPIALALTTEARAVDDPGLFVRGGGGVAWQRVDLENRGEVYGGGAGWAQTMHFVLGAHVTRGLALHGDYMRVEQDAPAMRIHGEREDLGGEIEWEAIGFGATFFPDDGGGFFELGLILASAERTFAGGGDASSNADFGWRAMVGYEVEIVDAAGLGAALEMQRSVLGSPAVGADTRHLTFGASLFAVVHLR